MEPMEPSNQTLHEILIRIEKKVDQTNGRVRNLEIWKAKAIGAFAVISVLFTGTIIPIIMKLYF